MLEVSFAEVEDGEAFAHHHLGGESGHGDAADLGDEGDGA